MPSTPGDPASYVAQVYIDRPVPVFFPPVIEGNGGVASVPEPSSLLMAGSALSLLGGAALRKRRRVQAA
jgi:PEP-CTERM motif